MTVKKKSVSKENANPKTGNNYNIRRNLYTSTLHTLNPKTHVYECMAYLIRRGAITNADAVMLDNNYRLSATIDILRKTYGVPISTEMKTDKASGKTYGIYRLEVE